MLKLKILLVCVLLFVGIVGAQENVPITSKIGVTQDAMNPTTAIVSGEDGAVFPNAVVVVQNMYTSDRQITTATVTGAFTARLYGQQQTPYWVSAFQNYPTADAINQAMGVIVYGAGDDDTFYIEAELGEGVARYRVAGARRDKQVLMDVEIDVTDRVGAIDGLEMQVVLRHAPTAGDVNHATVRPEYVDGALRFQVVLDDADNLGNALYFVGYVRAGDGEWQRWDNSLLLGTVSDSVADYTFMAHATVGYADGLMTLAFDDVLVHDYGLLPPDEYLLALVLDVDMPIHEIAGTLSYTITRPSGDVEVQQAQVIETSRRLDDSAVMLITDNEGLNMYPFDDYGDYVIELSASLTFDDELVMREATYYITIAERLYLYPTVLPSTSLEAGDTLHLGLHIVPPLPADVTLRDENGVITAQADRYGYVTMGGVMPTEAYQLTYSARYEDAQGRLWSSELMTVSGAVVPSGQALAHGQRGLFGYDGQQRAWFDTTVYPDDDHDAGRRPYFPYYAGDVAYVPNASDGGIAEGDLTVGAVVSPQGEAFAQDMRAGDYAFLFGHRIVDDVASIYGALMVVDDEDAPARVLSPFMDSLNIFGQVVEMFFVPTGVRPAQVLTLGSPLSVVGQVAPTLPAEVSVTVTSPTGTRTHFADVANAVGYFYAPQHDISLDEIGIWNVDISMTYQGATSAGVVERPYPTGQLNYDVYVVPSDAVPLGDAEFMTTTPQVMRTFSLNIPEGWTDVRAFVTLTTPSWILSQEELAVFPAGTSYSYNPIQLMQDYPNLNLMRGDVVNLTLAMTGQDAEGNAVIRTRQYTMRHDVTYTYDEAVIR